VTELSVEYIHDKKQLQEVTDYLKKQKLKATDIEGSTLSPYHKTITPACGCVGFAADKYKAYVYSVYARVGREDKIKVSPEEVLDAVQELWEDPECEYIMHFGKYDYQYMAVLYSIWMGGLLNHKTGYSYDTGQALYCLDERPIGKGRGLDDWAGDVGMEPYWLELYEYQKTHPPANPKYGGNANLVPAKILYPYNGKDCITTFRLLPLVKKRLIKRNLWKNPFLFPQMYNNFTAAMLEITGIKTDLKRNKELEVIFPKKITEVDQELLTYKSVQRLLKIRRSKFREKIENRVLAYKRPIANPEQRIKEMLKTLMAKSPMKWTPDERRTLIYKVLKYKVLEVTKTGQPVIKKKILEHLLRTRKKNKTLNKLLERNMWYYGYTKYVKPIPTWVGSDGRTHTEYKPHGQLTGRVPSARPNHENIPKRNPTIAPLIRSQFIPSGDDWVHLSGDEKQMELRLVADRAKDPVMIAEFEAGKDPHKMGASAFFEVPEDQVTKQQRTDAKSMVSFGIIYGRGDEPLANDFGKPVSWAAEKRAKYFGKYKRIPIWWKEQENFAIEHHCVYSHFGRRRLLPDIESSIKGIYNKAVRVAINTSVQGDASDILWIAGYRLTRWLHQYKLRSGNVKTRQQRFMFYRRSRTDIHIHDDITVDTYLPELTDVLERLHFFMTDRDFVFKHTGWKCAVPFDIDVSLSKKNLSNSVELERKGNEFIIPSEFRR
jgi:DNA polymerase I-like protein with 3'-5' exonuclease and polymerase domains